MGVSPSKCSLYLPQAVAMAAMVVLLGGRPGAPAEFEVSWEDLLRYFKDFLIELHLEWLHRSTDAKYEPATLASIFTDRDVRTWREPLEP